MRVNENTGSNLKMCLIDTSFQISGSHLPPLNDCLITHGTLEVIIVGE